MPRRKPIKIERPVIYGLADKANRVIEIQHGLKGFAELLVYVHEAGHVAFPYMGEKNLDRGTQEIAEVLWKAGYRKQD